MPYPTTRHDRRPIPMQHTKTTWASQVESTRGMLSGVYVLLHHDNVRLASATNLYNVEIVSRNPLEGRELIHTNRLWLT